MIVRSPAFARIAPFAVFMGFIALEGGLGYLVSHDLVSLNKPFFLWLYVSRVALVGLLLIILGREYRELNFGDLANIRHTLISIFTGALIFVLWIKMDWTLFGQAGPAGFDPTILQNETEKWIVIGIRIAGAVVIVPIMEELFWRSFLLRYLIDNDFMQVEIGRYSLFSFLAVAILFGLEHHYLFAGIMAGVLLNLVYYSTRSIFHCILSHTVANLGLAIFVMSTGEWRFW